MTITPVAPCYMKSAGCAKWQSLKSGSRVPIKPGDVCSLLPDKCWFKVISVPDTMEENDQILKRKVDEDSSNEADSKKACLSSSTEAVVSPSETLNILNDKDLLTKHENFPINGNAEPDILVPVLQEIYSASCPEGSNMPATSSKMSIDFQDAIESFVEHENTKQKAENINLTNETATDSIDAESVEKKIKWDGNARFSDRAEAASVGDRAEAASASVPVPQNDSQSPVVAPRKRKNAPKPDRVPREKCKYGTQCYRKNSNHKTNYSHPGDRDYDEVDNRVECPYGVKCYRKNPQHRAQYKHTIVSRRRRKATIPVPSATVDTPETDHSSAEESVDESDYEPSVYTESSDDWDDSRSEWEDGTTG
ncbi:aprataxin and PNK-like factor isoform X2 [Linepithema humile]|nr:PREDICTED: aprataxin and PNK-like factor isoform X1 [Linepithema humile]